MRRFAPLIIAVLMPTAAAADMVAVETVVGGSTSGTSHDSLAPVFAELSAAGVRVGDDLVRATAATLGSPSVLLGREQVAALTAGVEQGFQDWLSGRFDVAAASLDQAIATLQSTPGTMIEAPAARDALHRALVGVALAKGRLGDGDGAQRAMATLVRSFPDREFSRRQYGPEGHKLYQEAYAAVAAAGVGSLSIVVDDASVVIFVDERYVGTGRATLELPAGAFRVVLKGGKHLSAVHTVVVEAGKSTHFDAVWSAERTVSLGSHGLVVRFTDDSDRSTHQARVIKTMLAASGGTQLITLQAKGASRVEGRVYDERGDLVRSAVAQLVPGGDLSAFVQHLSMGPVADTHGRPLWKKVVPPTLFGLGVVAVGVGAYLVAIDGTGTCDRPSGQGQCPELYETKGIGYAAIGGGAALSVGAALWWLWPSSVESDQLSLAVGGDGRTLAITGRF